MFDGFLCDVKLKRVMNIEGNICLSEYFDFNILKCLDGGVMYFNSLNSYCYYDVSVFELSVELPDFDYNNLLIKGDDSIDILIDYFHFSSLDVFDLKRNTVIKKANIVGINNSVSSEGNIISSVILNFSI